MKRPARRPSLRAGLTATALMGALLVGASPVSAQVAEAGRSAETARSAQVAGTAGASAASVTYPRTTDSFANPERGFYRHTSRCDQSDFDAATLRGYRVNEGVSLVMCVFYLEEFKNSAISQTALNRLQRQFDAVRQAGLKTIVRFAYTESADGVDAPKDRVLAHLDQLGPYLRANSDVINVVQAGFVGAWGEGYYTKNFGDAGKVTTADWANRKAVVDKTLGVLPSTRMVQLRTPKYKRTMYGTTALPAGQAYNGSTNARLGHHNDCFLASADDYGTYENPAVEYPYLSSETSYLAMGGETCGVNAPRTSCPTTLSELRMFHWSYLNTDYEPNVINGWRSGGCLPEITRNLGYRFALQSGTYPSSVSRGGSLSVNFTVKNEGFAAPFNPRGLEVVLRNTSTSQVYRLPLAGDPRTWAPGTTTTVDRGVTVPSDVPAGTYSLLLNLPDPQLSQRPEYSVRLANQGTWEAATGYNDLLHTVTVS
ncbi:DUF4832 domain-containing protein [Streptomyces sp. NRRL F-5135]|uniref:DUF4832 domain-containing protein n=1 Tax=Streptomyces sp. NRRL F-5135 TaxID=1463858 RepID=UPI00099D060E|nr:DUF4832 domain-containing protein [Streptomyces sp. NRRL F-5135]